MKTEQMLEQMLNEMKTMNQHMGRLEQRVEGMDQRIGGMDQRVEGMHQRIKNMGDEIQILKNDVTNIKETMATKADIGRLEKSLEKTHLESLSSDEMILHTVREIKESIQHVNRRVADTELELHIIKNVKQ